MRKIVLIVMLLTTNVFADAYLLVMSKDDKVCQQINNIFNKDLFHYKEVRLKEHKEFNAVKWDKKFKFFDADGNHLEENCNKKQELGCKNAIFDINNDGKDELVAFMEERLYGTPSLNEMSFTMQDANNPSKFQYGVKSIPVGFNGTNTHKYRELPVQSLSPSGLKRYISSDSNVLLRPLKIKNTFYIATFFNTYGRNNWNGDGYFSKDINDNNMVSISKYDANNEQHDICYYIRVFKIPGTGYLIK